MADNGLPAHPRHCLSVTRSLCQTLRPAMSVCARACLYLSVCRTDVCQSLPAGPEAAEVTV